MITTTTTTTTQTAAATTTAKKDDDAAAPAVKTTPTMAPPPPSGGEQMGIFLAHKSGIPIDLSVPKSKNIPIVIFLAGYPDISTVWSRVASAFEDSHHVITMAMPDFEAPKLGSYWGYSVNYMIDDLHQSVILPYRKAGYTNHLCLAGHDWGAFVTLRCARRFPSSITHLVQVDIGDLRFGDGEWRLWADFRTQAYRIHLAMTFLVWRWTQSFQLSVLYLFCYPWHSMGPMFAEEAHPTPPQYNHPFMAYPYFRGVVTGYGPKQPFVPAVPQLFVYGGHKRFQFQSREYLRLLGEQNPRSRAKEYPDAGHYPLWTHADELIKDMKEFLQSKQD